MPEGEGRVEARAFWSGILSFGLVSIPVELLSAFRPRRLALHMLAEDGEPLRRVYVCPEEGVELSPDELARGFVREEGDVVPVTEEELEAVAPEKTRDIELKQFVSRDEVPPLLFERGYFLAPDGPSTRAYHLLVETMERTGRAGIATFVMRGKEHLVAIAAEGGVLRAELLRFPDEVRSPEEIGLPARPKLDARRVKAVRAAIAELRRDDLDLDELADVDTERLRALVEDKRARGEDVVYAEAAPAEAAEESGEVLDLMAVLKERMGEAREAARAPKRRGRAAKGGEQLARASKKELLERARRLDIEGRSRMSKEELLRAIRRAS